MNTHEQNTQSRLASFLVAPRSLRLSTNQGILKLDCEVPGHTRLVVLQMESTPLCEHYFSIMC